MWWKHLESPQPYVYRSWNSLLNHVLVQVRGYRYCVFLLESFQEQSFRFLRLQLLTERITSPLKSVALPLFLPKQAQGKVELHAKPRFADSAKLFPYDFRVKSYNMRCKSAFYFVSLLRPDSRREFTLLFKRIWLDLVQQNFLFRSAKTLSVFDLWFRLLTCFCWAKISWENDQLKLEVRKNEMC